LNFHRNISKGDFRKMQETNRNIYLEWISPVGFFRNMNKLLKSRR